MPLPLPRVCTRCKQLRSDYRVWRNKETINCNKCLDSNFRWRETKQDPEKRRTWVNNWYKTPKGKEARSRRKYTMYGLTKQQYEDLIELQQSCCPICKKPVDPAKFNTDHHHGTGQVRGLLCARCNKGLGHFAENIDSLQNAVTYLNYWNNKTYKTCGE